MMTSCQTDSVEQTPAAEESNSSNAKRSDITNVTYNYTYNRQRFTINYALDGESGEVLDMNGDTDVASSFFQGSEGPEAVLFTNLEDYNEDQPDVFIDDSGDVVIEAELFDTNADMEAALEEMAGQPLETNNATTESDRGNTATLEHGNCTTFSFPGGGRFFYYRNRNYSGLMPALTKNNIRISLDHQFPAADDNAMSSLIVLKPFNDFTYTIIYENPCFTGRRLVFARGRGPSFGIRNLRRYRISGFFWWRRTWDNRASSVIGASL
ncbi:hypothetical protein [Kordia sp. SMS9]|uniref:hypothetical protein n=1 Tax=Kordia sp. SMS9 TaxID=2282170 RepID=UPI0013B3D78F|nr:hypothetical protein [Kordia sp. SMS9]